MPTDYNLTDFDRLLDPLDEEEPVYASKSERERALIRDIKEHLDAMKFSSTVDQFARLQMLVDELMESRNVLKVQVEGKMNRLRGREKRDATIRRRTRP